MAGHSKWSNIKRKKGAADAKRGKIFTRVIKEINVAIKEGGGADPDTNAALRNAIANAKGVNMPKDNINRAIKKASGADADSYEEVTFEGYGPNGIAFFIECTTNNTNRTVARVREIFTKNDGNLGTNGSLEFLFNRKGVFTLEKENIAWDIEELELELIESGLESMEIEEDVVMIYTEFSDFGLMQEALEKQKIEVKKANLERIPLNTNELSLEQAKEILAIEEEFEEEEDVQNVFHNLELSDELIAELENK